MATDFDDFPIYDPIINGGGRYLSDTWVASFSYFIQSLGGFLSKNGMFVPKLTDDERASIKEPGKGQLIYNTTLNKYQVFDTSWKDLVLSESGVLVPNLTTAERDAIASPQNGQLIYNTTTNKFQGYEGAWVNLV